MKFREYRVTVDDGNGDKGLYEFTNAEQAASCFMDYFTEGYKVSFQTIERKAYFPAPTLGDKKTVSPSAEVGNLRGPRSK